MKTPRQGKPPSAAEAKNSLTVLKLTTTLGAVSLTLAGWGLLAQAESLNASHTAATDAGVQTLAAALARTTPAATATGASNAARPVAAATVQTASVQSVATAPTMAPTATAEPTPATAMIVAAPAITSPTPLPMPTATATPAVQFKLDVVQWTQTNAGDPVAVVQYNGVLWYVWGPDVDRIERGLDPQYQPVPVNGMARSRGS